jgi:multidrug resistance efflux pump
MNEEAGRLSRAWGWVVSRPTLSALLALSLVGGAVTAFVWRRAAVDDALAATVRRGAISVQLTASGSLRPMQSITYRSPLAGRETEVTFLVPEGTKVGEGDLLVRLDSVALDRDLERAVQELRQVQVELQVAEIEVQEGKATIESLSEGEAALAVEEARTSLELAEKRVERLRQEFSTLEPLLKKGFVTRDEMRKVADDLEQAEKDLALTKRRTDVLVQQTRPRDRQRATLQLAQKEAQRENVRTRLQETETRVRVLREQRENSSIYARGPGMVVFEEFLGANPRRKIRVGDRVTESQGIVTIPEVTRMLVDASVSEADVQRLHAGQSARIVLEAFRDKQLTGKVIRVGTLARSSADRSFEDKRFDVIVEVDPTDVELRPEMTARVDIQVGERSSVLLLPVNAIFERQGLPVVHVQRRFGIETRTVQIGQSSDTLVEVVAGVAEGERVALRDVLDSDVQPTAPAGGSALVPSAGSGAPIGNPIGR